MKPHNLFTPFLLLLLLAATAHAANIGVCYGRVADNLPPPPSAVNLLQSNSISKIRLFNPDPSALSAFSGKADIRLMIGVPNEILPQIANGTGDTAANWLNSNIFSHVIPTQVSHLAVGNEILFKDPFYTPHLLPALHNFHGALKKLGLSDKISISTPHAASVLATSYPPSVGAFVPYILPVLHPLLRFLAHARSPLMINIYPYFTYAADPVNVPLAYALFDPSTAVVRDNANEGGVWGVGGGGDRDWVADSGWGGGGRGEGEEVQWGDCEEGLGGVGTPRRPSVPVEVYLFGLFDENGKGGEEFERHFGIFHSNGEKAYDISFA
ncbi:Glucan endo-1,3-beta-glucosidase [Acorus calamus]|uniref:Glucan endo-1,3-beta-glucosidase n=1 Tax=Acorus calamus TaxID=4465 RepID=A0AAV9FH31_ACOCL|nr:Glucan endo-1,3-beta-glucosidase [Acorus calamus]